MEKIEFRGMWVRGDFYNASEVDALLMKIANVIGSPKDVGRLPEALKYVLSSYRYRCEKTEAKHAALLSDVRRLVDAVKEYAGLAGGVHEIGCPEDDTCSCHVMVRFEKAIAAVERHLATSPPHSFPPPEGNGKA